MTHTFETVNFNKEIVTDSPKILSYHPCQEAESETGFSMQDACRDQTFDRKGTGSRIGQRDTLNSDVGRREFQLTQQKALEQACHPESHIRSK